MLGMNYLRNWDNLMPVEIMMRVIYSGMTLYMLAILVRWAGPAVGIDTASGLGGVCRKATKPLIEFMERVLPPMGPINLSPLVALIAVWFVRSLSVNILMGMAQNAS